MPKRSILNTKCGERVLRGLLWCLMKVSSLFTKDRKRNGTDDKDKRLKILVIGTEGSGKSTVCLRLTTQKRRVPDCDRDTNGACRRSFTTYTTTFRETEVLFCELSGQGPYHDYPPDYFYSRCHAVIFVLDLSRPSQFEEAKDSLNQLMTHKFLRNKPFLIIGNKVDRLSRFQFIQMEKTIADRLNLRSLTLRAQTMTQMTLISAINLRPQNDIHGATQWLLTEVEKDFKELRARVCEERVIYSQNAVRKVQTSSSAELPKDSNVEPEPEPKMDWPLRPVSYVRSKKLFGRELPTQKVTNLTEKNDDTQNNNVEQNEDVENNNQDGKESDFSSQDGSLSSKLEKDEEEGSNFPAIAEFVYEEIDKAGLSISASSKSLAKPKRRNFFRKKSNKVAPS